MKILEMPHMQRPNRDARFPVSIEGATLSLTVGQIADMLSAPALLNFGGVVSIDDPTLIALGDTVSFGHVVYDTESDALYYRTGLGNSVVYYTQWSGKDAYHNEDGDIRIDCLFVNGETTYRYDGTRMVQLNQITSEIAAAIESKADATDLEQLRRSLPGAYVSRTEVSRNLADDSTTNVASAWSVNAVLNVCAELANRDVPHVALTEAEYEALAEKDDNTIYMIYEDDDTL